MGVVGRCGSKGEGQSGLEAAMATLKIMYYLGGFTVVGYFLMKVVERDPENLRKVRIFFPCFLPFPLSTWSSSFLCFHPFLPASLSSSFLCFHSFLLSILVILLLSFSSSCVFFLFFPSLHYLFPLF